MTSHFEVRSPFDQSIIGDVAYSSLADANAFLKNAKSLHKSKTTFPIHERIAIFTRLADLVFQNKSEIAKLATKEGGKPLKDSLVEIQRAIDGIRYVAGALPTLSGREIPMDLNPASTNRIAFTRRDPIGISYALSAFNHPFNLVVHQVVPALAVGCPVLLKPASKTPLSCLKFFELLYSAGLPESYAKPIFLDHEDSRAVYSSEDIAHVSFIGSAKIGWSIRKSLAPGVLATFEHGGAAPVIIDKSADLDRCIPAILKGGFYHSGQVCVSVQRVFIEDCLYEEVCQRLKDGAGKLRVGDPLDMTTDLGPMISSQEVDRVLQWINAAKENGAKILAGGKKVDSYAIEPTLLSHVPMNTNLGQYEAFGPVISLYSYQSIDEAIRLANALPYIFQAAVFSQDLDRAFSIAQNLDATAVMVNDHTAFRVDWMPFGGRKDSGLGMGGLLDSMHDLSPEKMYVININSTR